MSQESLLCPPLVHLRCVSGLLGQALPRVSKAQIRDSICTSFSLMSSSSSSCFGKPVPMLSREFCGGDGGKGDQQKDEGRLATHFSAIQSSLAGCAHQSVHPVSASIQLEHRPPWPPAALALSAACRSAQQALWPCIQTSACAVRVPLAELRSTADT